MYYVTQLPSATCAVMSTGLVSPGLTLERALKWSVCLSCLILGHFCSVADLISSITLNLQDMAILRHLEDFAIEVTLICFVWPQRAGWSCVHACIDPFIHYSKNPTKGQLCQVFYVKC